MPITINASKNYTLSKLLNNIEKASEKDLIINIDKDSKLIDSRSNIEILLEFAKKRDITLSILSQDEDTQEKINKVISKELRTKEKEIIESNDFLINGINGEEIKELDLKNGIGVSNIKQKNAFTAMGLAALFKKVQEPNNDIKGADKSSKEKVEDNKDKNATAKNNFANVIGDIAEKASITNTQNDRKVSKFLVKIIAGVVLLILLILLSLYLFYRYVPKSVIDIQTTSNSLVKIVNVQASPDVASVNLESNRVPAFTVSVIDNTSEEIETSGTKIVGEKALGTLTIVNPLKQSYELSEGARIRAVKDDNDNVLEVSERLEYILTEEITIPAATEEVETQGGLAIQTTLVSGTVEIEVEATEFGEEYNIDSDYTFSIVGLNVEEFMIKNTDNFEGGTTEEIMVVSAQDKEALLDIARVKLEESLEQKIKQKIVLGQNLNDSSIDYQILSQNYSAEIDAEAERLRINLEMEATGIAYKDSDIEQIIDNALPTFVPDSYDLRNDEYVYDVKLVNSGTDSGTAELQVKINTFITPNIDVEGIKSTVRGMDIEEAKTYLDSLSDIKYTLSLSPSFLNNLPTNENNIEVNIVNE